ncbi:hypothetical protein I7X12_12590 [Halosimplex litoreum]|uniref:Uncharacterized protein n=1 Tax=Halosimplex litoreum TaxID=1198301 RepID=A0A7T3FW56_9EURY|nr:hypothetical protein [Halosimplex litoreum]QPV61597.1 hypothetical protein I7X12_12590 [Halosimplex litoreum]
MSEDDVDDAVETIESLDEEQAAWDSVEESPGPTVQLLSELGRADAQKFFEDRGLSKEELAAISRQFDAGRLSIENIERLIELRSDGKLAPDEVVPLTEMLESKQTDPDIDGDLTAEDLLSIVPKADLTDTRMLVLDGAGNVRWLEFNEGEPVGYDKILSKHKEDFYKEYPSVNSRREIKQSIYDAIKKSETNSVIIKPNPDGGKRYFLDVESSDIPLRVAVSENGFILSAFPSSNDQGMFD